MSANSSNTTIKEGKAPLFPLSHIFNIAGRRSNITQPRPEVLPEVLPETQAIFGHMFPGALMEAEDLAAVRDRILSPVLRHVFSVHNPLLTPHRIRVLDKSPWQGIGDMTFADNVRIMFKKERFELPVIEAVDGGAWKDLLAADENYFLEAAQRRLAEMAAEKVSPRPVLPQPA